MFAGIVAASTAAALFGVLTGLSKPEHELIEDILTVIFVSAVAFCAIYLVIRNLHQAYWKDVQQELIRLQHSVEIPVTPEVQLPRKKSNAQGLQAQAAVEGRQ
ncbi:hypothetical protein AXW83_24565 [Bosea sp. PAMC 26642]|nr:hypothetical protein AXW83_24565 [Bosea sp. PAMC 26642]